MECFLNTPVLTRKPPTRFQKVDLNPRLLLEKATVDFEQNPPWPMARVGTLINAFHLGGEQMTGVKLESPTLPWPNIEESGSNILTCSTGSIAIMGSVAEFPEVWQEGDWVEPHSQRITILTGAISLTTSAPLRSLRELIKEKTREERLQKMAPNQVALYFRIVELREKIGEVDFDVVEAVRELREDV